MRFIKRETTVLDTQQNLEWSHTLGVPTPAEAVHLLKSREEK